MSCICNRKCAQNIDIARQKEIFDKFRALNWSGKIKFIRNVVDRKQIAGKGNVNPLIKLKRSDFNHTCFLTDDKGTKHRVCLSFLSKLLQVNRVKIFRAVASIKSNPTATDRRGMISSKKVKVQDKEFIKKIIERLPKYESRYNMSLSSKKYLHPDFNIKKIYKLYQENCLSEGKNVLSLSYLTKEFKLLGVELPKLRTMK